MAQTQTFETAQAQTPQQFTPEEATQILTDAVNLSSQYLTLAQLEAIADEAGVPRETLYQAIQRRTQRLDALKQGWLKMQERRQRWKTRLKKLILLTGVGILLVGAFNLGLDEGYKAANRDRLWTDYSTFYTQPEVKDRYLEELGAFVEDLAVQKLTSSAGITCYVMPYAQSLQQDGIFTSIWVLTPNGDPALVFKTSGRITRASISEDGKLLAMYIAGSDEGGVWVLDWASGEQHRVLGAWGSTSGYALPVPGKPGAYATAYGGEVSWVGKRKLVFSTTHGRYACEVNERGAPLRYERFDSDTATGK